MTPLLLTVGDPHGIGPEIACKALADRRTTKQPVQIELVGDRSAIERAAMQVGLPVGADGVVVHEPPPGDGVVEIRSIEWAVQRIQAGQAAGLVTGPINKERACRHGFGFTGHTDFLGHLTQSQPVMAFVGGKLKVALVTVHVPLRQVADALTEDIILHTLRSADRGLRDSLGLQSRRLAVCGLNPHAGDGGVLGDEEIHIIGPAVERARREGLDALGPMSAETAFSQAMKGQVDLVIAMFHDQGLAPLKAVDFGQSVNWTLGLPFVRTSVDHGTAYDVAWTGQADPQSMHQAIRLAERLTRA